MDKPYRGGKFAQKKQTKAQKKEANRTKQQSTEQAPSRRTTRQSVNQSNIYEVNSQPAPLPTNAIQPPWRQPKSGQPNGADQADRQAVDSWRSYTNSGTACAGLNPQASSFTPYQPLRISNGQAERRVMQASRRPLHTAAQAYLQTMTNQPPMDPESPALHRHYDQEFTPDPDFPIASVERTDVPIQHISQRSLRSSSVRAPTPPEPAQAYLLEAAKEPVFTATPRKLLVILDLNGTLLYRPSNSNRTLFRVRPGVPQFLDYLFENHMVMVYTSTRLHNATVVVEKVLTPVQRRQLVALWGREHLGLTSTQFNHKVQVYKKLEDVWESSQVQATAGPYGLWDQTNTVLVDDSHLKGLAQPHNLLQIDEYTKALDPTTMKGDAANRAQIAQEMVMKQLELQLEALKCQIDVSRLIRKWQMRKRPVSTGTGQSAPQMGITEPAKEEETMEASRQLLTPQSLEDTPECGNEDPESISESEGGARLNWTSRSVSPINEDTFKDLLSGLTVKGVPTPPAEDRS